MYLPIHDPNTKQLLCKTDIDCLLVEIQHKGHKCVIDLQDQVVYYFKPFGTRPYKTLDLRVLREEAVEKSR